MVVNENFGSSLHKKKAEEWFKFIRDELCSALEKIEDTVKGPNVSSQRDPGRFQKQDWLREEQNGGGGTMSILRGRVFEKAGVNISTVHGIFSDEFKAKIPGATVDPRFWATGVSVVVHPLSPHVPTAHMNTRMIVTTDGWFGGGGDLTPVNPEKNQTDKFHEAFKHVCNRHDSNYYPKFKKWCDEYFFLPHRNEPRGVGGIFFDNLNTGNWEKDFKFTQDVGRAFLQVYPLLVKEVMDLPWNEQEKEAQLIKRGRYVEFNLLYDRGTLFGLKTGGKTEAILMSMPPTVAWP